MELFPDTSIITANSKLHQKMIHFDKCLKKKKVLWSKSFKMVSPLLSSQTFVSFPAVSVLWLLWLWLKHLSQGGPLPLALGNRFFNHLLGTEILYSLWAASPHSTTALSIRIIKTPQSKKIKSKVLRTRESIGYPHLIFPEFKLYQLS